MYSGHMPGAKKGMGPLVGGARVVGPLLREHLPPTTSPSRTGREIFISSYVFSQSNNIQKTKNKTKTK
jgi:hypothetical protein